MNKKSSFKKPFTAIASFFGIYRANEGAIFAGVCKGIANRFGYKVVNVRTCWFFSVIFSFALTAFFYYFLAYNLPLEDGKIDNYKKSDDFIDVNSREI
ncbi:MULTISPECIES: PspC domain-containing protein [unclassified Gemella]|uniref:PspC domain-containing protein n=1 Tax=unclassified Gemella TaxID=2624949 RepID=UPI001C052145|nr:MULTISPECIES: PspC domain-containing protein [unclassified Gemella]MBU0278219.1 PspC domain-containing protein [Gemella sp. zg-1178]QWQ38824.1 PspC domain-containing protein [Gemella sp. zg-570]